MPVVATTKEEITIRNNTITTTMLPISRHLHTAIEEKVNNHANARLLFSRFFAFDMDLFFRRRRDATRRATLRRNLPPATQSRLTY